MQLGIMRIVVAGLWLTVGAACNKDDGGGGLQNVCEKLAACGGSPAQECVDQFGSCAAAEAKASECAGMSGCEAVVGCFLPVVFECLPEGTSSGGTSGTTADTVTPTSDATAENTSTTTEPATGTGSTGSTGSTGEASSGSSGDTDTVEDVGLYAPCAEEGPECPENYLCADTDAGKFCTTQCNDGMCPSNPVEGAEATCALVGPGGVEYCSILCDPKFPLTQCPNGLYCQMFPFQDIGICARN